MSWTLPKKVESAGKCRKRYVDSLIGKSEVFSSTAPNILQKKISSWGTSELSTLELGLLRTTGAAPYPVKFEQAARNKQKI